LARGDSKIEQGSADADDAKLIEDLAGIAKIRLAQCDSAAVLSQLFASEFNCIRILIEREDIGAGA
jgi:hypothetical protein